MEEDKRQNPVLKDDMDRFSTLMFGHRRQKRAPRKIEETEEIEEIEETEEIEEIEDHQTSSIRPPQRPDWILGHRGQISSRKTKDNENSLDRLLNGIDQQLLFETMDTAATFIEQMKPLLKEIKPHLHSMITKFTKK